MSPNGIGAELRAARLKRRLSLDNLAHATRIAPRYLEALEAEEYEKLPGLVFTRNFVRLYALELQMDPNPLLQRLPKLDESMVQLPNPPARPRARRTQWRISPALASAGALLLLGAAAIAVYIRFDGFPRIRVELLPSSQATAKAASKMASTETPQAAPVPAPEISNRAASAPAEAAPGEPAPVSTRPVQVVVTARQAAWVQVMADGKTAWAGTMRPNETRAVSAEDQVSVLTGNAGGVTISLNGRMLDPLGPEGQVRSVRLTADGPVLPETKPASPDPL